MIVLRLKYKLIFSLVGLIFLFSGCKNLNQLADNEIDVPTDMRQTEEVSDAKIVFLYFEIEKKSAQATEVRLTDTQVVDGRMKDRTIRNAYKSDGNLVVHLIDENGKIEVEQIIENPLTLTMEQYTEEGDIISSELDLQKAQFFIRYNHKSSINRLIVYSIQSNSLVELYNKALVL